MLLLAATAATAFFAPPVVAPPALLYSAARANAPVMALGGGDAKSRAAILQRTKALREERNRQRHSRQKEAEERAQRVPQWSEAIDGVAYSNPQGEPLGLARGRGSTGVRRPFTHRLQEFFRLVQAGMAVW